MSQVSRPFFHLASSSTQAASNCGPRRLSGSCAENTCATAPFSQTSRLRVASHFGTRSGGEQARMPLSPKIITSRTCSMVSPTRAARRQAASPLQPGCAPILPQPGFYRPRALQGSPMFSSHRPGPSDGPLPKIRTDRARRPLHTVQDLQESPQSPPAAARQARRRPTSRRASARSRACPSEIPAHSRLCVSSCFSCSRTDSNDFQ